ncbi:MAG: endonuclease [Ilumatobacteraceae bacterium]|nr:endonuclease [Ilumatobacteraceae bacterium]
MVTLPASLRDLADRIEGGELADLPDAATTDLVLAAVAVSGRVDALVTQAVGVFDAKTIWRAGGARSCGGWLAARSELSRSRAGGISASARDLRACPAVEAAYGSGVLGTAKVRMLLDARQAWPDRFSEAEADLVDRIAPLSVAHAAVVCATWAALAEAARAADEAERAGEDADSVPEPDPAAENRAHLSPTLDGRWRLDADYDPVTGAEIASAVKAWIDRQFDQGTYRSDDGLALSQRVAAALAELTRRGATPGQTKHGDPRPSVSIHIDSRTLAGEPVIDLDDLASRCCSLDDGTPITRAAAERLLCTARVAALLLRISENGSIETVGVTDLLRDATRKQRRALKLRDGGCVFTGCHAPPDQCEAHHLIHWEHGGPTLLANLVLLCRHHHHLIHEGGWHLWRSLLDGDLHLARPDGTPVALVPHGQLIDPSVPTSPEKPPPRPSRPRFETRRERHQREHDRQRDQRHRGRPPDPPPV